MIYKMSLFGAKYISSLSACAYFLSNGSEKQISPMRMMEHFYWAFIDPKMCCR